MDVILWIALHSITLLGSYMTLFPFVTRLVYVFISLQLAKKRTPSWPQVDFGLLAKSF
jgi:hypothetical protein